MSTPLDMEAVNTLFDRDWHPELRQIAIFGSITNDTAATVIYALECLESQSHDEITLLINSEGGDWIDALAIYDRLLLSPCRINAIGLGQVSSSASAVFQAANLRRLSANCRMLLHNGEEKFEGNVLDFEEAAQRAKDDRSRLYEIYASRSGSPITFWEELCSSDKILWADDAVSLGLADIVIVSEKTFDGA